VRRLHRCVVVCCVDNNKSNNKELKMKNNFILSSSLASVILIASSSVSAAVDSAAAKVELRSSCTENNQIIDNCFTGFPELTNWMSTIRKPDISNPLQVDIGAGTYSGGLIPGTEISLPDINITCNPGSGYSGYTSFNGAGNNQTILSGTGSGGSSALNITNCTDLSFSDLKITTSFYGGIYWNGGGNSRWTNIEVDTRGRAWAEPACGTERGTHYWYSSKINVQGVFTIAEPYLATCDETWFFGSEIKVSVPEGLYGGGAVTAHSNGIIHVYGSNIRVFTESGGLVPAAFAGGTSFGGAGGGEIHIHGTGIDVISATGKNITALRVKDGGFIHADSSAYVMKSTGIKTRIKNDAGTVKAAYHWAQSNQPPEVVSENGADIFVETNCDEVSCHNVDTGLETHLLIYNENCAVAGHGPWFDVVTRKCRGDMSVN